MPLMGLKIPILTLKQGNDGCPKWELCKMLTYAITIFVKEMTRVEGRGWAVGQLK